VKYSDQFTSGDGRGRVYEILRGVLLSRARSGKTITFPQLGERMGRPPHGPWPELDVIADEEIGAGRPDLSLVVVLPQTGYPARWQGRMFNAGDASEVAAYQSALQALYDHHRPVRAAPVKKAEQA
jgi:hypothetical protein